MICIVPYCAQSMRRESFQAPSNLFFYPRAFEPLAGEFGRSLGPHPQLLASSSTIAPGWALRALAVPWSRTRRLFGRCIQMRLALLSSGCVRGPPKASCRQARVRPGAPTAVPATIVTSLLPECRNGLAQPSPRPPRWAHKRLQHHFRARFRKVTHLQVNEWM